MGLNILTNGEIVKPHKRGFEQFAQQDENPAMDGRDKIAKRLIAFQKKSGKTGPQLAVIAGAKDNAWVQWTSDNYKRIIPKSYASVLCQKFELTLDWIYRGIPASRVPEHIRDIDIDATEAPATSRHRSAAK